MKTILLLLPRGLLAAALLTGCATSAVKQPATTIIPSSDTAAEIRAMPRCRATVEGHHSCYSEFRTTDGQRFYIGSPAASLEVVRFLRTLQPGPAYEFPGIFHAYEKTIPTYETAAQIKAMPPCQATVECVGARDACLTTADGRMFFIGSPAAPPEVLQFLRTLNDGQTYEFPAAFLAHQKKQSP